MGARLKVSMLDLLAYLTQHAKSMQRFQLNTDSKDKIPPNNIPTMKDLRVTNSIQLQCRGDSWA